MIKKHIRSFVVLNLFFITISLSALTSYGRDLALAYNSVNQLDAEATKFIRSSPLQVSFMTNEIVLAAFKTTPVQVKNLSNVVAVAAGISHALALKKDGTVWAWGNNFRDQLGDGTANFIQSTPVQVKNLSNVVAIAAGGNHSLALKKDGTVWAWGFNAFCQLGNDSRNNSNFPVQVKNLSNIKGIAAGGNHSLALKDDGTVWIWGINPWGYLEKDLNTPVEVKNLSNVIAIAAGEDHSLALKDDGTVWGWGFNIFCQLGNDSTNNSNFPVQVKNLSNIKGIAAGGNHSLALKDDGTVLALGVYEEGELEIKELSSVVAVAAGIDHGLALCEDKKVQAWGKNLCGQLGNGTVVSFCSTPVQTKKLNNIMAIAAGGSFSLAVTDDGTVWAWGYNSVGQIGDGSTKF